MTGVDQRHVLLNNIILRRLVRPALLVASVLAACLVLMVLWTYHVTSQVRASWQEAVAERVQLVHERERRQEEIALARKDLEFSEEDKQTASSAH